MSISGRTQAGGGTREFENGQFSRLYPQMKAFAETDDNPAMRQLIWDHSGDDNARGSVTVTDADARLTVRVCDYLQDIYTGDDDKFVLTVDGDATIDVQTGTVDTDAPGSADQSNYLVVAPVSGVITIDVDNDTDEAVKVRVWRYTPDGPSSESCMKATKQVTFTTP